MTERENASTPPGLDTRQVPRFWRSYLIALAIQLVVTWLNRGHIHEQGMYTKLIVEVAEFYRGGIPHDSPTYPMWGYPALVALTLPSSTLLLIIQSVIGAFTPALLYRYLLPRFPEHRRAIQLLVFGGLPWYLLVSVKWPMGVGIAISVPALLLLAEAIERASLRRVLIAGLVMGVALNVRSDPLLLLPGLFLLALVLRAAGRGAVLPVRATGVFWAVGWSCLIPWLLWYNAWTGSYSLTSSNGFFVAYTVLDQLPNNPWGARNDDEWGKEFLAGKGFHGHSFTHRANEIMRREFIAAVKEHPGAFAQKVIRNMTRVYMGGFYNGDPRISPQQDSALDIMREKVKLRLGVNPNRVEIAGYQAQGRWETLSPTTPTAMAFGYLLIAAAAGVMLIFAGTAGIVVARRRILGDPLFLIAFVRILYQMVIIIGVLKYEPRFMNVIYPFLVVFIVSLWASLTVFRRERGFRRNIPSPPVPEASRA